MQKRLKTIYIAAPAALVTVAAIVLAMMYFQGFFYHRRNLEKGTAAASADILVLSDSSKAESSDMLTRTKSLLKTGTSTSPFAAAWYALPGSTKSVPALQSEYILASDQVQLLRCYIAEGDRDSAAALADAIDKNFTDTDGYLIPYLKVSEIKSLSAPQPVFDLHPDYDELPYASGISMEATSGYLRALLEYYSKWGLASDWTRIEELASRIYSADASFTEDLTIEIATPTPLPTGEGQDIVSSAEGETSQGGPLSMVTLSSLDLEVFRMLSSVDSKYQPMYDKALEIISGGYISSSLPLYAMGYTQSTGGYVYVTGGTNEVDLVSSLKVILHLAEEGQASPSSLLWLKGQLYNEGALYRTYDVISGQAVSEDECEEAYGLVLQIAAASGDANLYSAALNSIEYHLATSTTSKALGAVYRQLDSTRVVVYAVDNLDAYLGLKAGV